MNEESAAAANHEIKVGEAFFIRTSSEGMVEESWY